MQRYHSLPCLPGPCPLPPPGLLSVGSRPAAATRHQSVPVLLRSGPQRPVREIRGFLVTPPRVPARSSYAASSRPGRGPLALHDTSPTLASSGQAHPNSSMRFCCFQVTPIPGHGPLPLRGPGLTGLWPAAAARLRPDSSVLWPGLARPEALLLAVRVRCTRSDPSLHLRQGGYGTGIDSADLNRARPPKQKCLKATGPAAGQ
jgi:hypothetical protein